MSFKDLIKAGKKAMDSTEQYFEKKRKKKTAKFKSELKELKAKNALLKEKAKTAKLQRQIGSSRPQSMFGNSMNLSVGMAQTPQRGWSMGSSPSTKHGKVKDERRRWRI